MSVVVMFFATLSIIGWISGIPRLSALVPGLPTMKMNTALALLACALALWMHSRRGSATAARIASASAAVAVLIGVLTIVQHAFDVALGIDELFWRDQLTPRDAFPGRPGLDTSLSLTCIGSALLLVDFRRLRFAVPVLAIVGGAFSYFTLLAYAFSVVSPTGLSSPSTMALHTAASLGLLSLGTLLVRTEGTLVREIVNFNVAIGVACVLLAVMLGVTAWNWWWAREERAVDARAAFAYEATALRMRLMARMARNEVVLTSVRALLSASETVTREEWRRFVDTLRIDRTLPGVLGLGYAPRVLARELDAHVAAVRKDAFPGYRVWPEGERAQYTPIMYLEPLPERNLRAIGYDMFSEPARRAALIRAMQTGETAITGRVQLVQETGAGGQAGFLMYAPAYHGDLPARTPQERRVALRGYVYSPFRVGDFMGAMMLESSARVALELYDGPAAAADKLLYRPPGDAFARRARFRSKQVIEVGGRAWTLGFVSTPEFEASLGQRTPEIILYGGTAISLLIFTIALALITARRRALALADRRTVELRQTNERLVRQTRELERSNAELEQFAYVASHDLREPLRTVTSFTQLLEEEYGSALRGDAHRYMTYIVDGNRRMKMLIDDLLSLSRVGARSAPHQAIASEEVVRDALHELSQAIEESGAIIRFEALPGVRGDRLQLVQLFQNLLGNALKFRSVEKPRIVISATRDEEWWQFAVADNGIGIERKYFDRVFVIFQRLHGRGEYAGNGIGLAICKKIVERHGGLIWVESEPGRGATFYFTLRAA